MPTIKKPNQHFDATLWTGDGATTRSLTNASEFRPDLIWIKGRSNTGSHTLQDSNRGFGTATKLSTNSTNAENNASADATDPIYGYVTAVNSNGFTVNNGTTPTQTNQNGTTYVGWQWKAGEGTTTVNTSGSISSNVSVNATAGFSIGTFTSPASGTCSVGHGLGVKPAMTIVKCRSVGNSGWFLWHQALGDNNTDYLSLQSTAAEASFSTMWGTVGRTSTLLGFTQGGSLEANATHVFYAWAEVEGYSKFGSYTGNGSTDGPFVYTGFRPKFILCKKTSDTSDWILNDTSRDTFNETSKRLFPSDSAAESGTYDSYDILSNGFKMRNTNSLNISSASYIFMAFAESPFKYSNAR
jgi:hypothetical protein